MGGGFILWQEPLFVKDILEPLFVTKNLFVLLLFVLYLILLFEFSKEISSKIERGTYHIRLSADDQIFYSPLDSVLSCR